MGPVPIPFPVKPEEACGNWGLTCPLVVGNKYQLKIQLPIKSSYPKVKVGVRLQVLDENKATTICTKFPAEIVSQ